MVSRKLQDRFYAALESLKDGRNDSIVEALAAGARAAFESEGDIGYTGTLHADATGTVDDDTSDSGDTEHYVSTNWPSLDRIANPVKLSMDDIMSIRHDPEYDEDGDPVDLVDLFDDKSGKRFSTYRGQFAEKEPIVIVDAVNKLGMTIGAMKHGDNAPLVEAIKEGYKAVFEGS